MRINNIADTQAQAIAASSAGLSYADMQKLGALRDAAKNEVGAAGMFMGMQAGNMLGGMMNPLTPENHSTPVNTETTEARLIKLKHLKDQGLISEEEFSQKKSAILSEI